MKLSNLKTIIAEEIKKIKENQYEGCKNGIQLTPEQMSELVPAKLVMENPTKYGFSTNENLTEVSKSPDVPENEKANARIRQSNEINLCKDKKHPTLKYLLSVERRKKML